MSRAGVSPHKDDTDSVSLVREMIENHSIDTVIVGGCDMNGLFRGKRLPAQRFLAAPAASIRFADYLIVVDLAQDPIPPPPEFHGWWPSWGEGFGDIEAIPDLSTFRVASWLPNTGIVLCDYRHLDGEPVIYSARQVLRQVLAVAENRSLRAMMGPELEFFLLRENPLNPARGTSGDLRPVSLKPSVYGVARGTQDESVIQPLRHHLERSRIPVERCEPEGGAGQCEVNLCYADILEAADRAFLFKQAAKDIAASRQLLATFMAKPFADGFGSGFHVHQSLWSPDGDSLFYDSQPNGNLSEIARYYIGGSLESLSEFTCLFAPTVNSYKRLVPHSAAGTTTTWGQENRTASIRAISGGDGMRRIELRTPGADANPYLVMAGALAGGLHGIQEKIQPPIETNGDAYLKPEVALPATLEEAAKLFAGSLTAERYFGREFVQCYSHTRLWEAGRHRTAVTDWEIARYLDTV